jgi:hypothetical protein
MRALSSTDLDGCGALPSGAGLLLLEVKGLNAAPKDARPTRAAVGATGLGDSTADLFLPL